MVIEKQVSEIRPQTHTKYVSTNRVEFLLENYLEIILPNHSHKQEIDLNFVIHVLFGKAIRE